MDRRLLMFLLLRRKIHERYRIFNVSFVIRVSKITRGPIRIMYRMLTTLPKDNKCPRPFFLKLRGSKIVNSRLISNRFVNGTRFHFSRSFPITRSENNFKNVCQYIFFRRFLRTNGTMKTIQDFCIFRIPFIVTRNFQLMIINASSLLPISYRWNCFLQQFLSGYNSTILNQARRCKLQSGYFPFPNSDMYFLGNEDVLRCFPNRGKGENNKYNERVQFNNVSNSDRPHFVRTKGSANRSNPSRKYRTVSIFKLMGQGRLITYGNIARMRVRVATSSGKEVNAILAPTNG